MLNKIVNKLFRAVPTEMEALLTEAHQFPRYKKHSFQFNGMKLTVTDFLSVAYQLKEYFYDERMLFPATGDPVIYDCGANVGVSVLFFKKIFPSAKITAFEPDPEVFKCLNENMQQNKVNDVTLIPKAVWVNDEGIEFGSEGADGGSVFHTGNKIKVNTVRLKDFLAKETAIDCLKVDIEGAEVNVLKDCGDELKKVKYLFVEYHSWKNESQQLDELLSLFTRNGFRYYIHSIGEANRQPFLQKSTESSMDIQLDIHAINIGAK
ncbi:MAG: FkbM family methyltransferase [Bacteroidota bacterium]